MNTACLIKDGSTPSPDLCAWLAGTYLVDAEGAPLRVFHGSRARERFECFQPGPDGFIYFSTDRTYAEQYIDPAGTGKKTAGLYEAFVRITNPRIYDGRKNEDCEAFFDRRLELLDGQDGAVLLVESRVEDIAVRNPAQIRIVALNGVSAIP